MATHSSPKRAIATAQVVIPDRLYFKIGDVAEICGLETYVLRFWETQFPQLKPNKSGTGQRLYRRRDVEMVLEIKRLVHAEGYTLAGARHALEGSGRRREQASAAQSSASPANSAEEIASIVRNARAELHEIVNLLSATEPMALRRRTRVAPIAPRTDLLFPS